MKKCEINRKLLPIKMHYFLSGAGMSGVMPFIPVLGKQLGISATGVGIVLTVALFIGLVAKPLFGGLADYFKKLKWIMCSCMFFQIIILYGINFIPPYPRNFSALFPCNETRPTPPPEFLETGFNCSLRCGNGSFFSLRANETFSFDKFEAVECAFGHDTCDAECSLPEHATPALTNYRFFVFFVLYVLAYMLISVVTSLSDAACYELLGGKFDQYGRQRLWGTAGWGFFSLVGGYLITSASNSTFIDYSPGFHIMLVILFLDLIVLGLANISSSERSENILRDVGRLLKKVPILLFLLSVFCVGVLTALQWSFLFWYLKDLGATPFLLGLSLTVQCFLGELPTFVFSGLVVSKIGHILSITVTFAAYAIRFFWYSFIHDPWYVLPVETMHGVTFGLFYTAMTSYAKSVAPTGTEATMQGIVGATFECLGVAAGNLIGGVMFDCYGGRSTYRMAGIVAVVCGFLNLLSHLHNRRSNSPQESPALVVNVNAETDLSDIAIHDEPSSCRTTKIQAVPGHS